jgi:hypothetical protein
MYGYGYPSGYDHFPANIGPIMSTDGVDPALVTENGICSPLGGETCLEDFLFE